MRRESRPTWAHRLLEVMVVAVLVSPAVGSAHAGAAEPIPTEGAGILSPGRMFSEGTGESLYRNICQGCHMADGRGAVGAGSYPSLAGDSNFGVAAYPVHVVVDGLRGMPAFGPALTDDQVIAVVGYVRTHFGNHEAAPVTADDVRAARQEGAAP